MNQYRLIKGVGAFYFIQRIYFKLALLTGYNYIFIDILRSTFSIIKQKLRRVIFINTTVQNIKLTDHKIFYMQAAVINAWRQRVVLIIDFRLNTCATHTTVNNAYNVMTSFFVHISINDTTSNGNISKCFECHIAHFLSYYGLCTFTKTF